MSQSLGALLEALRSRRQLTVTGREEMIDSVTEIQTEPIDVSGATETVQGNYNLVLPNGVNSNTTTVRVKVEIQKKVLNG